MKIRTSDCIACGLCLPYCSLSAIYLESDGTSASIDQIACVDCGVCLYSEVCPVDALIYEPQPYPRSLRALFSNPRIQHEGTKIPGRGTEEMKTNDVTDRFKSGWVGLGLEFGRPGISTNFRDLEKMSMALARQGVLFENKNPVTCLMKDISTGKLKDEILDERVMSAIIECLCPISNLDSILPKIKEVSEEIDTVFSFECICKADSDGSYPVLEILSKHGIKPYINSKQNVGLGKAQTKKEL